MAFNKKAGGSCRLNFKRRKPMRTTKGRSPPTGLNSEKEIAFSTGKTALLGQIIQIIISRNLKITIMKTAVIGSEKQNGAVKNTLNNKPEIRPAVPLKENTNQVDPDKEKPKAEAENTKPVTGKTEEQPKQEIKAVEVVTEEAKAEPTKVEIKEQLREEKPAMNLEATIKLALDLNRRINQRGKLLETIGTLEEFEVAQKDDAEETDSTHFQRCELTIEDDKGREFTTKNPFIINAVAKMVNTLCVDKLAEIEGEIFIPVK
jgi:flagellar biosynthesis GTPase FlhF